MTASRKLFWRGIFLCLFMMVLSVAGWAVPSTQATPTPTPAPSPSPAPTPPPQQDVTLAKARVQGVASDQSSIDVLGSDGATYHLLAKDMVIKDRLKELHGGDYVSVLFSPDKSLKTFSVETVPVEQSTRLWIFAASALIFFLLYWLFSGFHPSSLIMGEDGRYSNSKFQIVVWFAVLITTYIAMLWLRAFALGWDYWGGINIPQNLLLISGMSAFTFGAAKGITTAKVADAKLKGNADPKNSANAKASLMANLTQNDGVTTAPPAAVVVPVPGQKAAEAVLFVAGHVKPPVLDLGDFQMVVITLLAVSVYLVLVFHFSAVLAKTSVIMLPDVDTTILATFGLGHGAYLAKKAVSNVGEG
jgi:hypothetical protein